MSNPRRNTIWRCHARNLRSFANAVLSAQSLVVCAVFGLLLGTTTSHAFGQQNQQQLLQDLKRLLEESQRSESSPDLVDPSNSLRRSTQSATRELQQIRHVLGTVSQEGSALVDSLYRELQRVPGIRSILGEVMKLQATLTIILERSYHVSNHADISPDLLELDRDWRVLSYRLSMVRGLGRESRHHIKQINDFKSKLSTALKIEPQLDKTALILEANSVSVDLRNLVEDIRVELEDTGQLDPLLLLGRKVQKEANHLSHSIADGADYKTIVREFKHLKANWSPLAAKLEPFENQLVERDIRRIHRANHALHKLLWIPEEADWQELSSLTRMLTRDVRSLYDELSLNRLIEMPNSREVFQTASAHSDACKRLEDAIARKMTPKELAARFDPVRKSWLAFANDMVRFKGTKTWASMKDINVTVASLQTALHVEPGFDREVIAESIATMESLSDHLRYDMKTWLDRREYSRSSYRTQYLREVKEFSQDTHAFHEAIVNGADVKQLRQRSAELYGQWRKMTRYFPQCRSPERKHLMETSRKMTASLVQLQTQLAL